MIAISFNKKFLNLRKIQKFIKFSILKDEKLVDKILVGIILDKLYDKYNILATVKYNREVLLCLEPPLTIENKHMKICLNSIKNILKNLNIEFIKFFLKAFKRKLI